MKTYLMVMSSIVVSSFGSGCVFSSHASQRSTLGVPRPETAMAAVIDQPGVVEVETVVSVDWQVPLGGLVNLDSPTAKAAHLVDRPEPIQVFFHVLRHPEHGMFLVDSGMETRLRDQPSKAAIQGLVASVMHLRDMTFRAPLGDWLKAHPEPLRGVFLTHLHLDHVSGLVDAPSTTAIYAGPGEAKVRAAVNVFLAPNIDRILAGKGPVNEWPYLVEHGQPSGVVDVFGDGSVWAIPVPGHTPGATAYLVRTPHGPVLLTGDASHTRWGWDHDVEPGTFNADTPASRISLAKLRALAARHPAMDVRLGHQ